MFKVMLNRRRSVELDSEYMFVFDYYIEEYVPMSAFIARYEDDYYFHTVAGSRAIRYYTYELAYMADAGIEFEARLDEAGFKSMVRRIAGFAFNIRLYPFMEWLFKKVGRPDAAGAGFSIWGGEMVTDTGDVFDAELPILAVRRYSFVEADYKYRPAERSRYFLTFCAEDVYGAVRCNVARILASYRIYQSIVERMGGDGSFAYVSGDDEVCGVFKDYKRVPADGLHEIFRGFAEPLECDARAYRYMLDRAYREAVEDALG